MRISQLSERSGVPVATVKYYLREGLLHPGEMLNARQRSYDETHITRLHLIRGLVHALGNSIEQVRLILNIIDGPSQDILEAMAQATRAVTNADDPAPASAGPTPATRELLEKLEFDYDPESPDLRRLEDALALAQQVGIDVDPDQLSVYIRAVREIAQADFERIPWNDPQETLQFAVLGTALYEPVLLALRRLAHYELGLKRSENSAEDYDSDTGGKLGDGDQGQRRAEGHG
ncbi:MerR family transcriptional regulator [Natronoglycomyces albus]|uniref:MerR family transcriptional regulator n=1 Tax=Natronoglycomyces albus TaxID=2811108 RepID=A0A895XIK1_9ACTN|nr:MerR family transcriptional regulator [Natronoglycomyces albus]QSB05631.1 MerR family transcriptional regulator [Natronoglycomyces albus]